MDNIYVTLTQAQPINVTIEEAQPINVTIQGIGSCGSSTLDGLSDTNISSKQNNDMLIYDAANQVWINKQVLKYDPNTDEFEVNQL